MTCIAGIKAYSTLLKHARTLGPLVLLKILIVGIRALGQAGASSVPTFSVPTLTVPHRCAYIHCTYIDYASLLCLHPLYLH